MPDDKPKPDFKRAEELLREADYRIHVEQKPVSDAQLTDIMDAIGDDRSGNANPFVPWSDPQIPYQCECGAIIYSDSVHEH